MDSVTDFTFDELILNQNSNLNLDQININNKTQVSPSSTLQLTDSQLGNSVFNFLYDKESTTNVTFITSPPLQTPNPGIDSILTPTTT